MKVAFVSHHGCARVVKEGVALLKRGVGVVFIQHEIANNDNKYALPAVLGFYNTREGLRFQLSCLQDIDLVHVHNTPDWLVEEVRAARPDLPIVFDVHDMDHLRYMQDGAAEEERRAFALADAYVFPSLSYVGEAAREFADEIQGKPSAVIYTMVNEEFVQRDYDLPRVNGVVYEGGLSHPDDDEFYPWLDFGGIAESLTRQGIPFHLYGLERYRDAYSGLGAVFHGIAPYRTLVRELSRYDCGIVGVHPHHIQQRTAMPNKLFEYIAAGIPVIAVGLTSEAAGFVERYGFGVAVDHPDDVITRWQDIQAARNTVKQHRHEYTMETQAELIIKLYELVLHNEKS